MQEAPQLWKYGGNEPRKASANQKSSFSCRINLWVLLVGFLNVFIS